MPKKLKALYTIEQAKTEAAWLVLTRPDGPSHSKNLDLIAQREQYPSWHVMKKDAPNTPHDLELGEIMTISMHDCAHYGPVEIVRMGQYKGYHQSAPNTEAEALGLILHAASIAQPRWLNGIATTWEWVHSAFKGGKQSLLETEHHIGQLVHLSEMGPSHPTPGYALEGAAFAISNGPYYKHFNMEREEDGSPKLNFFQSAVWHSPTGMEWGYSGSGPADTALSILNMVIPPGSDGYAPVTTSGNIIQTGAASLTAATLYQEFKEKFIAPLPKEGGTINIQPVRDFAWARRKQVAQNSGIVPPFWTPMSE